MTEALPLLPTLAAALVCGFCLGMLFFGGLRLSLPYILRSRRPRLYLLLGFYLRAGAAFGGLRLVLELGPGPFVCGLVGFFLVRIVMTLHATPFGASHGNQS